jgi:hypothetical protein
VLVCTAVPGVGSSWPTFPPRICAGANWSLVATFVDHTRRLAGFIPKPPRFTKAAAAASQKVVEDVRAPAAADAEAAAARAELAGSASDGSGSGAQVGGKQQKGDDRDPDDYEVPFMPRQGTTTAWLAVQAIQHAAGQGKQAQDSRGVAGRPPIHPSQ